MSDLGRSFCAVEILTSGGDGAFSACYPAISSKDGFGLMLATGETVYGNQAKSQTHSRGKDVPISALVITLAHDPTEREAALSVLSSRPQLELGDPVGMKLPAVVETPSLASSRRLFERLQLTRGVQHVDVLSVDFEDEQLGEGSDAS